MLKVFGVTYDHSTNYGSCFQAYALQSAIEKMIINGETCSYCLIPLKEMQDYPFKRHILYPFFKLLWNYQRLYFKSFDKNYMKYAVISKMSELTKLNDTADAFVCGSDVIWNTDLNHRLGAYYLDFAKKYAFSYAASFGKAEISQEDVLSTRTWLQSFNAISVREKTSFEIAKRCAEKPVEIVADPVILLKPDEWKTLTEPLLDSQKYIFVYSTHMNKTFKHFLSVLKKQTRLKVVLSICSPRQAVEQRILSVYTPQEWLSLLRGAEYVLTNSFHATVFSTLFHKKFFTVVSGDKAKGINMRMNDFLNTIGLENRIYSSVPDTIDISEIDYKTADEKIAQMRDESLMYLQRNLEEAYRQKMQQA